MQLEEPEKIYRIQPKETNLGFVEVLSAVATIQ